MAFTYTLIPPIIHFNFLKQGSQEHIFFEWISTWKLFEAMVLHNVHFSSSSRKSQKLWEITAWFCFGYLKKKKACKGLLCISLAMFEKEIQLGRFMDVYMLQKYCFSLFDFCLFSPLACVGFLNPICYKAPVSIKLTALDSIAIKLI